MTHLEPHLEEDVNGIDGHDLEDVVGSSQDGLELELDDRTDEIEKLVNPATEHFR